MKFLVIITLCLLTSVIYAQPRQYLVAGQSNARGRGLAELAPKIDTLTSLEFRSDSNRLVSLKDPVGVDFGGFQAAALGSPWPAFAKTYHDITADTTIIIPAARGGSGVHLTSSSVGVNWSSIGLLYTLALFKTNQAKAITNQELDGVIWLQGETDAARISYGAIVQDDYRDALIDLIERFRSDHGCHLPFYIILVGTNTMDPTFGYDAVRAAQREVADVLPHTYLIHETTYAFPDSTWMSDNVHYSQDGYNNVGEVGATNLAAIEDMYYKIAKNTDGKICKGDSVMLTAPAMYQNYLWSNGDTLNQTYVTTGGRHTVTVTDDNGCSFPLRIDVASYPKQLNPSIEFIGNDTLCVGDEILLNASSGLDYLWSNGANSNSITVDSTGDYFVQTYDLYGCISDPSDTISIVQTDIPSPLLSSNIGTNICEGDTAIISAPPGFNTYQWSNGSTTQSIQVSNSGAFTCVIGNSSGCSSPVSSPINIQVNPIPTAGTISFVSATSFCEGDSATLTASSQQGNFLWSNGDTTKSITVYDSGIYTFSFINENNCPSVPSAPVEIIVHPTSAMPTITLIGSPTLCKGDSLTLIASAGFSDYQWSNGDTTQNITVSDSGIYDFFIINDNGCTSPFSNPVEVFVDTIPTPPVITVIGSTILCEGESVTLSMPPNYSYQWSNGDTTQNIIVYEEGLYNCTISNSSGCSSVAAMPVQILVNPLPPIPVIQSAGPVAFCDGDSLSLSVSGGYSAYLWSSGETTQSITVYDTGTHYCTVSDFIGCQSVSEAFNTTMNPMLPTPEITYSGSTNFCEGASVTLFAPAGYIYQWSNGETTQDITITETSGPLFCVIMNNNGCMSNPSDTTFVTVSSQSSVPIIQVLGDTDLCLGESVELSAPENFDTYLWSNGQTTQNITIGLSGAYTVAVANNDDCLSEYAIPVEISVNAPLSPPTILILGSTNFCEGDSVLLRALQDAPGYLWSDGQTTQTISVNTSGAFSCILIDDIGCQSQSSITVNTTVNANLAPPIISILGDSIICEGDTTVLSVTQVFDAYFWSNGAIDSSIDVTTEGSYSCYVIDENGCESLVSNEVTTQVRPLPPVLNINSVNLFDFCEGDSITLLADANYEGYLWSTGDTSPTITVDSGGDFYYTAIDDTSCRNPMSDTISTTTNPMPTMPAITRIGQDTLCASELAETYLWYRNDTLTTYTTQCITPDLDGAWQAAVSIAGCSSSISESFDFEFVLPPSQAEPSMDIYPNPTNDLLTIQTINIFEDDATFEIYDMIGRLLYIEEFDLQNTPKFAYTIDIRQLPDAPYVAVLRTKGTWRFATKFIISK